MLGCLGIIGERGKFMGRKIAIVSGKGGVGKTTICAGLGMALAKGGASVCLIDLDVGLNNLDILFNIENKIVYDISDCLSGKVRVKEALVSDPLIPNLFILPSQKDAGEPFNVLKLRALVDRLSGVFDFVLIDAPAGINDNFHLALSVCEEVLVVVTPHISSIRDADKVVAIVRGQAISSVAVVINRIRGDMVARKEMLSHIQIEKLLKVPLLGVLPESDDVCIHSSFRFDRVAKGGLFLAFNILASNLRQDKKVIYDYDSRYRGILGTIRRNIKRSL